MPQEKAVGCEERDRLAQARQSAQREQFELEEKLGHLLVSPDRNVSRKAKNEIERARRRSTHALQQLMDHQSNHRCW
jgi:tRNA(Arg) A34 adenosine deaminase TadA